MDEKKIEHHILNDEEKLKHLEKLGYEGLTHLISYLKMKDDQDFINLGKDVDRLLIALYHIGRDETHYLKILNAKDKQQAVQLLLDIIVKLEHQLKQDLRQVENKSEIDLDKLNNLIEQFKKTVNSIN